jgi:hypothetical protein
MFKAGSLKWGVVENRTREGREKRASVRSSLLSGFESEGE